MSSAQTGNAREPYEQVVVNLFEWILNPSVMITRLITYIYVPYVSVSLQTDTILGLF